MEAPKSVKRRKITDKTLPESLAQHYEDQRLYKQLVEAERKLDWTVSRKKVELQDSLTRSHTTHKVLRVFVSHTCFGQPWQSSSDDAGERTVDFETGGGIPSWKLKVEGRLLGSNQKFSTLLKAVAIDIDRDQSSYPESNHIEWRRVQGQPEQDGFEITRRGDLTTPARVVIHVDQSPERYKLSPPLASCLQLKEGSRAAIVTAMWNYVKIHQLQDKSDRRLIKTNEELRALSGHENLMFQQIPEFIDRHLLPADPFVLHYVIQVDPDHTTATRCFDLQIEMEDGPYKSSLSSAISKLGSQQATTLSALEDEIAQGAQAIRTTKLKQEFFLSLSKDPETFIQRWLASQSKDLDLVLGNEHGVREEDLKNSAFFSLPWVEDAVSIHEGSRVASALQVMQQRMQQQQQASQS